MHRAATALLATAGVAVAFGGAVVGLSVAESGRIAGGISIGGVDVGGLSPTEAASRIEATAVDPLRMPVVVERRGKTFRLTARESQIGADVDGAIQEALAASEEAGPLRKAWRSVTGDHPDRSIDLPITWSKAAVQRYVDRIRVGVDRQPVDATLRFAGDRPQIQPGRTGMAVDRAALRSRVAEALRSPSRRAFLAPVDKVAPKVSERELRSEHGTVVVVDRAKYQLYLYKRLSLSKTYGVAVGMQGLDTPAGTYTINDKQVNPSWHVPESDWAGDLAGTVVPPGPTNPIKARWMGFFNGAGIHGTSDRGSIGSSASHGCVRMLEEDVIDLYDRVPLGTTIHVI